LCVLHGKEKALSGIMERRKRRLGGKRRDGGEQ
jgi:hypothetical protein